MPLPSRTFPPPTFPQRFPLFAEGNPLSARPSSHRATFDAIATTADTGGSLLVPDGSRTLAIRTALAVAMRRRNHILSRAPGEGAGEREVLRTVLQAALRYDPDAVAALLPIVPVYGSWRDLLVLGEELLEVAVQEGRYPGPSEQSAAADLPPEVDAICATFVEQLLRDRAVLDDGEESKLKDTGADGELVLFVCLGRTPILSTLLLGSFNSLLCLRNCSVLPVNALSLPSVAPL